ncbi:MAG: hypothetical protein ACOY32_04700 [Thermodesulfobacteriota bacterium]
MNRIAPHIGLAILALLFMVQIFSLWSGDSSQNDALNKDRKETAPATVKQFIAKTPESRDIYEIVAGRPLFSPERKEYIAPAPTLEEEQAEQTAPSGTEAQPTQQEVRVNGQEIMVYGILYLDDLRSALINNPVQTEEDTRSSRWINKGEKLANLVVDDITRDSVIFRDKNQRFIVPLRDAEKPKETAPKAAAPPKAEPKKEARPTVVTTEPKAPPAKKGKKEDEEGFIIIDTPFGPVKQPKHIR